MPPHCFCAGTMLVTLRGEVPAESVVVGDLALTLSGEGAPLKPVIWTGRVELDLETHPDPIAVRPIRIAESAIEPGMPIRDLRVSPDHGISFEDDRGRRVLVPAHFLVNGATVTREPAAGRVTYVHVEVDTHEVLMADGMAAESYFDHGNRAIFGSNVIALRPATDTPPPPAFAPQARETNGVAPLLVGAATHAIHARLRQVAEDNGWVLTEDPGLAVLTGGTAAETIADADGDYVFLLPPGSTAVTLHPRQFVPAETDPAGGDQRPLGAAIARIVHDGTEIDLAGPGFGPGFLPPEGEPGSRWRWTVGDARLDLPARDYEATLEITVHRGWSRYWLAPTPR
jgi:hypothetical protein